MAKYFLILISWLLLLSSCKYSTQYQTVNANQKFSLTIPPWLKEDDELKPGADFQYSNHYRNFYAIAETVDTIRQTSYMPVVMEQNLNVLRKSLVQPLVSDSNAATIGGLPAIRVEIFGKMSNENIYFSEVLVQGKQHLFHLSVWTRGENRKLNFKEEINQLIASFKEI